jgi:DNA-binding NarL/FixJ family response regulator
MPNNPERNCHDTDPRQSFRKIVVMAITIFIADDHAVIREGLAQLLKIHSDFEIVGAAGDGRDAVSQVSKLRPDVVIMDVAMPDMNGIEATRQIHETSPATRVVILSMYATPEYVFHALEAGANGYLHKESIASDIANAVREVHAGRRYLGGRIADALADQFGPRFSENPISVLSKREREVLQLVAEGHSSVEIGERLHLSFKTVDTYRSRLMQKLHIRDLVDLVKFAILHGVIVIE